MSEIGIREAEYWDRIAGGATDQSILDADASPLNDAARHRIAAEGDVAGKRVLDAGCGMGGWSVNLAKRGAEVWAIDISPASVEVTNRRARLHGLADRIHASVMSATELEFPCDSFDLVVGQDVIHHVDATAFGREMARVLAPGGQAVFRENCANNPILMFARNRICGHLGIPKWSSDDEYPLTRERVAEFGSAFSTISVTYPDFMFFRLANAKIFKYKSRPINMFTDGLDHAAHRVLPFARQYSYRQMIECVK